MLNQSSDNSVNIVGQPSNNFMGLNGFVWFIGVVEDRNDPMNIGRLKVRIYGWHTEDKTLLPTAELPWAQVILPVTSASIGNIGTSPTGIHTGAKVFGFFADDKNAQVPIIIGSIPHIPTDGPGMPGNSVGTPITEVETTVGREKNIDSKGFVDPRKIVPTEETIGDYKNVGMLSGAKWDKDPISVEKKQTRVTSIPTARRFKTETVSPSKEDASYELTSWNEPEQRGAAPSVYPYNKVIKTESGHAFEVDDSKEGGRIHEYHRSGTYTEIINDGTRTTKVVGDDFEIVVNDKNVLVKGNCNVTVNGNCRLLVAGDLIEEVSGDYHLTVRGNVYEKIDGSKVSEIKTDKSMHVEGHYNMTIGRDQINMIGNDYRIGVVGNRYTGVVGNEEHIVQGDRDQLVKGKSKNISVGNMDIGSNANLSIAAGGTYSLRSKGNATLTYDAEHHTYVVGKAHYYFADESHFTHKGVYKYHWGDDSYFTWDTGQHTGTSYVEPGRPSDVAIDPQDRPVNADQIS